jgi:hypothetical protein
VSGNTAEAQIRSTRHPIRATWDRKAKKEEFPGIMENMLPENSFPQICVVSENEFLRSVEIKQEYERSVVFSTACLFPGIRGCYGP